MLDLKHIIENVPPVLLSDLGTWKQVFIAGKKQKHPVDPRTGVNLKPNEPDTWLSLDQMCSVSLEKLQSYDGFGRVSQWRKNKIIAIDIDDCFQGGELKPWVLPYVDCGSYFERSPSGTGLRGFVIGDVPEWLQYKEDGTLTSSRKVFSKGSIPASRRSEVMVSIEHSYMTITGDRISDAVDVYPNQKYLNMLFAPLRPSGSAAQKRSSITVPAIPQIAPTPPQCESLLSQTPPTRAELENAIQYLSRPEVCKFFADIWAGKSTRYDISESGDCAGIIESCARVGYGEEIARGISEDLCKKFSTPFNPRKWARSWSKLSVKFTPHPPNVNLS